MHFIPNKVMNLILFRKSLNQATLMLPDSLYEIRGYPYIEGSITAAREDIDTRGFRHVPVALDSRFRGNDGPDVPTHRNR